MNTAMKLTHTDSSRRVEAPTFVSASRAAAVPPHPGPLPPGEGTAANALSFTARPAPTQRRVPFSLSRRAEQYPYFLHSFQPATIIFST